MNKRILICLNSFGIGGVETACFTQIKEYCRRNYEVYVLAGKGIYTDKLGKLSNVTFIEFDYEHKNGIELQKIYFVIDVINKYKIDLVYIHKLECILSVFPACILSNTPYIAYLHMGIPNTYDWYLGNLNITHSFLRAYFCNAYKIIGITDQAIDENRKLFNIEKDKYILIPNSIDFNEFCSNNTEQKSFNNLLFISRLDKDKGSGIQNAINFFIEYKQFNSDASMDIVGDGTEKEKLEEQIKTQGLNIKLLGAKNNVSDIMKNYSIVLGVDRCVQEAIAMKKLVIIVGYEGYKGLVTPNKILDTAKSNFSGRGLPTIECSETVKMINDMTDKQTQVILNENYNWLFKNRNIENNIYEVKNFDDANKFANSINNNELLINLFEEIGNLQRKYDKDIKNVWDIKESTENYYLNREKWNESQLQNKDKEIEKLKEENNMIKKQMNGTSNKIMERIRNNRIISKIKDKNKKD